jgi:putative transposase
MGLGEKKQAVIKYNSQGLPLCLALPIAGISKHQYYYQQTSGKPGRKVSTLTLCKQSDDEVFVENQVVVERIKTLHSNPDLAYGYHGTTRSLQQQGLIINHKKVCRLMAENDLLKPKRRQGSKKYVTYRKVHPTRPLEVIEMDLKMVWIERDRRHAYVLNIIDTFSRKWLYQSVAFSITQHQVKQAWEHLIEHHLQPNDMLKNDLHIEIRNDNDKRFSANMVQQFFKDNHLNQVFTHPYTPQENGHVESFHAILSDHLKRYSFWNISELEQDLILFQNTYNNVRLHGSIAHLCPNDFEILWNQNLIQMSSNVKKRRLVFKLKIPRYQINQHTGNNEPEGSSLLDYESLNGTNNRKKQMIGAETSDNLRSNKSPSVVPCKTKIKPKISTLEKVNC